MILKILWHFKKMLLKTAFFLALCKVPPPKILGSLAVLCKASLKIESLAALYKAPLKIEFANQP
jgi:hypothetical protein